MVARSYVAAPQQADHPTAIMSVAGGLGAFHTLWALRNYFLKGYKRERGMITMGLVTLGFVVNVAGASVVGFVIAIVGAVAVVLSFTAVSFVFRSTKLCGGISCVELAARRRKSVIWAKVYRGYNLVELLVWLAIMVLLIDGAVTWETPDEANGRWVAGKEWLECGPACPNVCGEPAAQACIQMCMPPGWYCAGDTPWWDAASGTCKSASGCP
jgi:hypothetical protein